MAALLTLAMAIGGLVAVQASPAAAQSRTIYVSPNGNDSSAGTATAPFRTLARAARSTRAGTTVFVAAGDEASSPQTPQPRGHRDTSRYRHCLWGYA